MCRPWNTRFQQIYPSLPMYPAPRCGAGTSHLPPQPVTPRATKNASGPRFRGFSTWLPTVPDLEAGAPLTRLHGSMVTGQRAEQAAQAASGPTDRSGHAGGGRMRAAGDLRAVVRWGGPMLVEASRRRGPRQRSLDAPKQRPDAELALTTNRFKSPCLGHGGPPVRVNPRMLRDSKASSDSARQRPCCHSRCPGTFE